MSSSWVVRRGISVASGNNADYEIYLKEIGAVEERDDVFAASCYCSIHNLENSDALDANGEGSFKEHIKKLVIYYAKKELDIYNMKGIYNNYAICESKIDEQEYPIIKYGKVVDIDWGGFVGKLTRIKVAPAFDALDLLSPENEEFGTETIRAKHFTTYSMENSEVKGTLAEPEIIKMPNPTKYIGKSDTAKYWRIRHGAFDRDTSMAIPVILALLLANNEYHVDFFFIV